jgi:carboxymethylenebutenolidase
VVIQEMFGVSKWLRSYVDSLAAAGFLAVAPDLYHRQQPRLELSDQNKEDFEKAMGLYKSFPTEQGISDLIATVAAVRKMPECNGKVATVGFCLGGKLAFLMAAKSDADCNVGFYPTAIQQLLSEQVKKPLLVHIAMDDSVMPPDAQRQAHEALDSNPVVTICDYPQAGHAFMRTTGQHYDARHASAASERTLEYLKQHLVGQEAVAGAT